VKDQLLFFEQREILKTNVLVFKSPSALWLPSVFSPFTCLEILPRCTICCTLLLSLVLFLSETQPTLQGNLALPFRRAGQLVVNSLVNLKGIKLWQPLVLTCGHRVILERNGLCMRIGHSEVGFHSALLKMLTFVALLAIFSGSTAPAETILVDCSVMEKHLTWWLHMIVHHTTIIFRLLTAPLLKLLSIQSSLVRLSNFAVKGK